MKRLDPTRFLSPSLLRHVRDARPTREELLAWLGPASARTYHVLRRAKLLVEEDGRVSLSPDHRSADGVAFRFGNQLFLLDEDQVLTLRGQC